MYYLIYGLLYCISLLPFFILYRISDFFYFIVYYVAGYRKAVVLGNLDIAFPNKSSKEKETIAKQFYKNLIDTFIESIKLLSISKPDFNKRVTLDFGKVQLLIDEGKSIQIHSGHQMNWEYGHWAITEKIRIPWVGVYNRLKNKAMERLFFKIRNQGTTVLVPGQEFKARVHHIFKEQYALGLVADQNPGNPAKAYWLNFFNRPAPFQMGPDKGARRNNTAVVFIKSIIVKRGYYRYEMEIAAVNANEFEEGQLTLLYRDYVEQTIKDQPDNYLWSHRRWKWDYKPEYKNRWIDKSPPPELS